MEFVPLFILPLNMLDPNGLGCELQIGMSGSALVMFWSHLGQATSQHIGRVYDFKKYLLLSTAFLMIPDVWRASDIIQGLD